jgi:hypothetical protein
MGWGGPESRASASMAAAMSGAAKPLNKATGKRLPQKAPPYRFGAWPKLVARRACAFLSIPVVKRERNRPAAWSWRRSLEA